MRLKPRTELIPCQALPAMFNLLSSFCIWTKHLTYISQLTSNNLTSCCKSHSELCPLKMATAETSWELLYRFYYCFPHYTLPNLYIYIYDLVQKITHEDLIQSKLFVNYDSFSCLNFSAQNLLIQPSPKYSQVVYYKC